MSAEIAAVIVNYNAGSELVLALQSLASDLAGREWEAVVVDNASTDGSDTLANAFAPRVRLTLSPRLWLASFAATSVAYLIQTDVERVAVARARTIRHSSAASPSAAPVFTTASRNG